MTNLFNSNTSNDYITPTNLAACPGTADTAYFEFLTGQNVGVTFGSDILQSMALGDISQEVTGWVQQTKILQPGEVVFVQGLTKGISTHSQRFLLDNSVAYTDEDFPYYLSVDLSINYYKSFKYYQNAVTAIADASNSIDIANALNLALDAKSIAVTALYDTSALSFIGNAAGYTFDITRIDVSLFQTYSDVRQTLTEDTSSAVPAYKYPNGAMLGYVLKVTYSNSVTNDYEKYVLINHVLDTLTYYEASTGNANSYVKYTKDVDVGLSGASCTSDTMSAAEYLDYVTTNDKWEKVGVLRMWLTAEDPTNSNTENLITGFYIYNSQNVAVQLDYLTIL
jgi:hypothetical protein